MIFLSIATVAGMTILAVAALARLPADARLPIHWTLAGNPDHVAPAKIALLVAPTGAAVLSVLLACLPAIAGVANGLRRSAGLYETLWVALLLLFGAQQVGLAGPALGWPVRAPVPLHLALAFLFVAVGNLLGKSRPMRLIGFRTPWALANEDNWIATNRLGGRIMVIEGMLMVPLALLPLLPSVTAPLRVTMIGVLILVPCLRSWRLARAAAA
ncbi:SdpI family protein [Sphingomonas morindae]|uniref:SdpI family protein n=1 Tax=Sphingomonas morindae TaxID=1541170 RepID=A0ABY4X9H4_9SPHN|nr:SdpI family protein [Sphingomonas morindae]USI73582.1 SdpI family protein [Sphingomonas morindae]